jgi:dihydropteroate synthase
VVAGSWEERLPASEREWGTVAAVALAVRGGADILRIHDRSSLQATKIAGAIRGSSGKDAGSPNSSAIRATEDAA